MAELSSNKTGGNRVQVKTKNEKFTVHDMCSRSPQNLEFGHFALLLGQARRRHVPKFITHAHAVVFLIKSYCLLRSPCRRRSSFLNSLFSWCCSVVSAKTFPKTSFKGEVSREFDVISKPKNVCLSTETKKLLSCFVINYHPSAIKLLICASSQRQSRSEWT